jgi:hypothetical protein
MQLRAIRRTTGREGSVVDVKETELDPAISAVQMEIEESRARLSGSLQELRKEVDEVTDWRRQYTRHPGRFLLVAALAGWAAESLLRFDRGPRLE